MGIFSIVMQKRMPHRARVNRIKNSYTWIQQRRVKAFFSLVDGLDFESGSRALMQCAGIGKLKPNVVLMGYKQDWRTCPPEELLAYFNVLQWVGYTGFYQSFLTKTVIMVYVLSHF